MDRAAASARRTSPLFVMVLRMRTRTTPLTVLPVPTAPAEYNAPSGVMKPDQSAA